MGLPSKRRTKRSKRDRASHFALKPISVQVDADGTPHLPHRATKAGSYRGKTVATKTVKRTAKRASKKA